jgi:cysteine desulfurase
LSVGTTYLDWNATAPLRDEARAAMQAVLAQCGNPSSVHRAGRNARAMLETARAQVAALVGVRPPSIVFTSGGSEANAMALAGFPARRLIVSAIEHDSVRAALNVTAIPAKPDGTADLGALARMLAADPRPALVSLMAANNETGAIQDIAEASRLAHRHGALLHCDAVQAVGKIPFDFTALACDLATISAHKLGGPQGIGALVIAPGLDLAPLIRGGGQERGRRAGTENLSGIVGFGAAAEAAMMALEAYGRIAALRDLAERRLFAIAPDAVIHAAGTPRLANTLCVSMPGVAASTQIMALDLAGVMVSAGSACSSGKVKRSHVLEAMGVASPVAESAIRISLGWRTTEAEIEHLIEAWGALYARTRASAA